MLIVQLRCAIAGLFECQLRAQEVQVERLKLGLGANLATPELARLLIAIIDQLVSDIR